MFGDFEYVTDYRDDAKLRGQFDELTRDWYFPGLAVS